MENNLSQIKPGSSATVKRVSGNPQLTRKLLDMGITKGTQISVVKLAPFGDPIEIAVRGYSLSLRRQEAENILVI